MPLTITYNMFTQKQIVEQLRELGVVSGDLLMVHASMRSIGQLQSRGETLIAALLESVGNGGTLTAYVDYQPTQEIPYFDLVRSPAQSEYGVFPEILRTYPNAVRSLNPGGSMVAVGAKAEWLCANHPLNYGYGGGSPLAKICEVNGKILLLGSDLDHVTILHLAEHCAQLPNKRVVTQNYLILKDGNVSELNIEEYDTSELVCSGMPKNYFAQIMAEFIENGKANKGVVGKADSYLLNASELVGFAIKKMELEFGT